MYFINCLFFIIGFLKEIISNRPMIPNIIHYCWFGNQEMSSVEKSCLESWKKILPDFEIKIWNETNFDINFCQFSKRAYELKQFAFVSDVARIYVLYTEGGVYLDTDMLLLKPFPELLKKLNFFIGKQTHFSLNAGVIGGIKGDNSLKNILEFYKKLEEDPSFDNMIPIILGKVFSFSTEKSKLIEYYPWGIVLPPSFFYPLPYKLREFHWNKFLKDDTIAVHLWAGSWLNYNKNTVFIKLIKKLKYQISRFYVPRSFLKYAESI